LKLLERLDEKPCLTRLVSFLRGPRDSFSKGPDSRDLSVKEQTPVICLAALSQAPEVLGFLNADIIIKSLDSLVNKI